MRLHVRDLTRRFPTIVIAVAAIPAVFSVLLADEGDRYVFTFAGTGEAGAGGDGGPATEAQLSEPRGLAVDGSGNLYVSDSGNGRIRRIDAEGVITTIAGTGGRGFSGDGGPATEAQFAALAYLAADELGNLYVSDSGNHRIRRIDTEGVITTIAGTGVRGFSGDGGPATEARFSAPGGLALDGSGNLYVADSGNNRIRRIDAEGVVTTIAGSGPVFSQGGYSGDGGPATEAQFALPRGLALDGSGNLYVADSGNQRIRVIRPPGERNPVTNEFPHFANGDSTVSDLVLVNVDTKTVTPVVRFYSSKGDPISADLLLDVTGDLDVTADGALAVTAGIPPLAARTISTHGRGALTSGSVRVVSDGYIGGFLRFDSTAVGVAGVGAAQPVNDALFPARRKDGGINTGAAVRNLEAEAMTMTCHLIQGRDVLATTPVQLAGGGQKARFINELFPDADTSDFEGSVRCTAPEGKMFTGVVLEMDAGNRIFTTLPLVAVTATLDGDVEKPYVFTFAGTGEAGEVGNGGPATEAQFAFPTDPAVDGSGNLYVADSGNQRIAGGDSGTPRELRTGVRGFGGDGGPATEAQFAAPTDLALDGSGNLYVTDLGAIRIRRIDAEGVITTIAGSGPVFSQGGYSGDGGPATEAQFALPRGLAVDGSGNLYVADSGNLRIRVIRPPGERNPVTNEFPHFANGDSTVSDLVLVNVDTKTVTPVIRFYSSEGDPISADSLLDVTGDLELTADGALAVTAGIPPLAARTISTHGRGALTSGSVRVVSDGYIGGFLRFDSMAVGVAGVGAAQPVNDALFPARRKKGGINTGAAVRNLEAEAVTMTCHLIQGRDVLATTPVQLAGGGQKARFINELFPDADTSDFEGSVRCTAPEGKMFTGVALEMDAGNRIFTTLPLVPVRR